MEFSFFFRGVGSQMNWVTFRPEEDLVCVVDFGRGLGVGHHNLVLLHSLPLSLRRLGWSAGPTGMTRGQLKVMPCLNRAQFRGSLLNSDQYILYVNYRPRRRPFLCRAPLVLSSWPWDLHTVDVGRAWTDATMITFLDLYTATLSSP